MRRRLSGAVWWIIGGDDLARVVTTLMLVAGMIAAPLHARAATVTVSVTVGNHYTPGDVDPYPIRIGPVQAGTAVLPLVVPVGNDLIHLNRDLEGHNLTALDRDENGQPLFAGQTIGQSQASTIITSHLPTGDYPFVCTIHSEFMQGVLSVV